MLWLGQITGLTRQTREFQPPLHVYEFRCHGDIDNNQVECLWENILLIRNFRRNFQDGWLSRASCRSPQVLFCMLCISRFRMKESFQKICRRVAPIICKGTTVQQQHLDPLPNYETFSAPHSHRDSSRKTFFIEDWISNKIGVFQPFDKTEKIMRLI